jgi:hypothetical protein
MTATSRRSTFGLSFVLLSCIWVLAGPATAAEPHATATAPPSTACEHPCTRVADCPKVTCECEEASATGVAACDTDATHCCVSANVACERFCEVNHTTWTGRYTPEGDARPQPAAGAGGTVPESPTVVPACAEPCAKADDCHAITCQCAKGTANNVSACDPKLRCCGGPSVVCEHFCGGKKGKWTGKLVEEAPPASDTNRSLRELYDDGDDQDLGGEREE